MPVYFLIDVSESMVGEPIVEVERGIKTIIQELNADPYALETVFVSVIAFAGKAKCLTALTELYKFISPQLPIGGGTSLGAGLSTLMDNIDRSVKKTTAEAKGDWKPIVFLFTDGAPTDKPDAAVERWRKQYKSGCNLICVSLGDNVDTHLLGQLSDHVLRLKETNARAFKALFQWVTASIKASSLSVGNMGRDELDLTPVDGVLLEKADTTERHTVDENFAVLFTRCSTTKKPYLNKFAKQGYQYNFVGAYPIDEAGYMSLSRGMSNHTMNAKDLYGYSPCPCCGAEYGVVFCNCGGVICSKGTAVCPWCSVEGTLGTMDENGMIINRGRG